MNSTKRAQIQGAIFAIAVFLFSSSYSSFVSIFFPLYFHFDTITPTTITDRFSNIYILYISSARKNWSIHLKRRYVGVQSLNCLAIFAFVICIFLFNFISYHHITIFGIQMKWHTFMSFEITLKLNLKFSVGCFVHSNR